MLIEENESSKSKAVTAIEVLRIMSLKQHLFFNNPHDLARK
jgi:hypothetical protein